MTRRCGVALPAVLFAVALTSALVVAGAYAARTSNARARLARTATELQAPVERALIDLVVGWDTTVRAAMPIGTTSPEPTRMIEGVSVASWITRLNVYTWWVIAEGASSAAPSSRSRMGVLIRAGDGRIFPVSGPAWTRLP